MIAVITHTYKSVKSLYENTDCTLFTGEVIKFPE